MIIRHALASALTLALALAAAPASAQRDFSKVEIATVEVAPGLFMLKGAGGNIGLSVGGDGAFVIDDQFEPLAPKILAAIGAKTAAPVRFVVNTHWHGDHSGGNTAFAAKGVIIVAQDNVRKRLKEGLTAGERNTPPAPTAALPVITFSDSASFYWNGQDIHIRHRGPAHTDGDAVVFFETANVIHTGDVYFTDGYPYIDLASGGSLDGAIATQEMILAHTDKSTKIIPGHGDLSNKAELEASLAMLKEVRARIAALIARDLDEDAIVRADPLKDLNGKWGKGYIKGESMTRTAFKSLSADR